MATGRSSIVTYELRFDGFVYLAADHGANTANFITRPVTWRGGDLLINADAAHSAHDEVTVAVLDGATRQTLPGFGHASSLSFINKNETAQAWSWGGGHQTMHSLEGKVVCFELTLTGTARLYSLRGQFRLIS